MSKRGTNRRACLKLAKAIGEGSGDEAILSIRRTNSGIPELASGIEQLSIAMPFGGTMGKVIQSSLWQVLRGR